MMKIKPRYKEAVFRYELTAPLSHIGKIKSTGSYFQKTLTAWGEVPIVTANSFRGQMRNSGATHLLETLEAETEKEPFHVLYSGGNLNGTMKNDVAKALSVRAQSPFVSLFGASLGDMILAGKFYPTDLYPICKESQRTTGIESKISWRKMMSMRDFSRMDDSKDETLAKNITNMDEEQRAKATTQMRYAVQYLAPGTELWQKILLNCNEDEYGAFIACIVTWLSSKPTLGGMANKGFGFFNLETDIGISLKDGSLELSDEAYNVLVNYTEAVRDKPLDFSLLKSAEVKKNGKKTNKAAESDSETA